MRNQITRILLVALLVLLMAETNAQIVVEAKVDKAQFGAQERISLQFIVKASDHIQQFVPPDFKDLQVLAGPLQVHTSKDSAFIMEYELRPLRSGQFTLHGASVKVRDKRFVFNAVHFSVQGRFYNSNTIAALDERFADYVLQSGEELPQKIRHNHFIKVDVDKTTVREGEPVVATFKLYTRLRASSKVLRRPGFAGFSVTDMVNAANAGMTTEVIDGKVFNVYLIRKVQLYPLQAGTFTIEPVEIENEISFLDGTRMRNYSATELAGLLRLFELEIDSKDVIKQSVIISSPPVVVEVKPLPETGKNFRGAVGEFEIETDWDAKHAVFTVTVNGMGNFSTINAPDVDWPSTLEVYDAGVENSYSVRTAPLNGSKLFHYKLVAKDTLRVTIPPIAFTFFSPASNAYKTVSSNSLAISPTPGAKTDVADILEVRETNPILYIGILGFMVLVAICWIVIKKQKRKDKKVVADISPPMAKIDLTNFRKAFIDNNDTLFYNEMGKVLHQKIKLIFNKNTFSAVQVKEILVLEKVDEHLANEYVALLERSELFKYTSLVKDEKTLEELYRAVTDVLERMESKV